MPLSQRNYRNYSYSRNLRLTPKKPAKRHYPRKPILFIGAGILVIGVLTSSGLFNGKPEENGVAGASTVQDQITQTPQPPPPETVDISNLQAELTGITKKYPYNTSVSVLELNSGKLVQSGDSYPFLAASTTKLLTAFVYLKEIENNKFSLTQKIGGMTAEKQLQLMINQSDNNAWNILNTKLGKAKIEAYAKEHGISSYDADRNVVTSNDMALVLSKFYKRELLDENHTKLLLSWMKNTSEERFIPSAIPKSSNLYHKAGYLEDRVHDVAIVDNGKTPFVIVIYSKSYGPTYDYTIGQKLYKEVTTHVAKTFKH